MGHRDAGLRNELLHVLVDALDRLHPVVEEEDLPAARQLALDRLLDHLALELANERADGAAVHRRRRDDREIPHARHRHVQRARDRRRRERQDIDLGAQLLQRLLVLDAEPLLLVDDHQAEILEGHVGREEPVGADQHVDLPLAGAGEDLAGLLRVAEARDHLDGDRIVLEPLGEGAEVLGREDGGGHQHRHLLLVLDDLEGCPQRHLGLAVADVAADQPVHRLLQLQIGEDVVDRLLLVGRLLELEVGLEGPVHLVGRGEGVSRVGGAGGVELEQPRGHLQQLLADPRLALLEALALERIEPGGGRIAAHVLLDLP